MIQVPHTKDECMRSLDETLAAGTEVLSKYEFGCMKGDHTAYAMVNTQDESSARNLVPQFLRSKAKVIPVQRMTPESIKALHAGK
jgi:hypothetical protein